MSLVKFVVCLSLLLSTAALAHEFPCGHTHLVDETGKVFLESVCNNEPSACGDECFQMTTRSGNTYCTCGQGDCETAFAGTFNPDVPGPLQPNSTRVFWIDTGTVEALSVLVEEMEVASFGPTEDDTFGPDDINALFGTTTLEIGSFDNLEAIPITVNQFDIELVSLAGDDKESGQNIVGLRDGVPVEMLYNSVTNRFSLANSKEIAIKLELENELAGHQPAVLYFDGRFDEEGHLAVFGQIAVGVISTAIEEPSWGWLKLFETKRTRQKAE